ncbi:MAG: aromatic ring-hydroxylating dioxygenase subunit alpha [Sphingomonadaceae bacterium]|nr:aromatic ring-hydroxylating dioxygenase subunit alpha [Sphingomonadaceae bacterium]
MGSPHPNLSGAVEAPVEMSTEPYISEDYAREEREKLWLKVWQVACREEEIPNIGDYYTYEILDQSVIVVRTGEDEISAYHNACRHRGRRLTKGCGHTPHFHCPYHGWQYNLQGDNTHVLNKEDWSDSLDEQRLRLKGVKLGRWAGFVFINFDPDCESLEDFLQEVPYWIGPFQVERMRYKWRQWLRMDCNWKVSVEGFIEGYHSETTHPQTRKLSDAITCGSSEGLHGRMFQVGAAGGGIGTGVGKKSKVDVREAPYIGLKMQKETVWTLTTDTFIEAARQLPELLPEDATAQDVSMKLFETAIKIDAERGVDWPSVDPEHLAHSGINWHVFPNTALLPNMTFCMGFRMRPDGFNPDSSIMEIFALERYPEGEEPETQWEHKPEHDEDSWPLLVRQDFKNFTEIQLGMKSVSLADGGMTPNPLREACVINFQRNLAAYMDRPGPKPLEPGK